MKVLGAMRAVGGDGPGSRGTKLVGRYVRGLPGPTEAPRAGLVNGMDRTIAASCGVTGLARLGRVLPGSFADYPFVAFDDCIVLLREREGASTWVTPLLRRGDGEPSTAREMAGRAGEEWLDAGAAQFAPTGDDALDVAFRRTCSVLSGVLPQGAMPGAEASPPGTGGEPAEVSFHGGIDPDDGLARQVLEAIATAMPPTTAWLWRGAGNPGIASSWIPRRRVLSWSDPGRASSTIDATARRRIRAEDVPRLAARLASTGRVGLAGRVAAAWGRGGA